MGTGGPGPHGHKLGVFECISKSEEKGMVTVLFGTAGKPSAVWHLEPETAEYFIEGQSYEFSATTP